VVARQGVESQDIPVIGKELTFRSLERINLLNLIELKRRDCHEIYTEKHRDGEPKLISSPDIVFWQLESRIHQCGAACNKLDG
jgi:hypothetical protein